jgi:Antitoxin MazE-like
MPASSKTKSSKPKSSRLKVRQYRGRLRAQGLRPIQMWVPDVRAPSFRSAAHRQSLALARSAHADHDQAFIDAVSDRSNE